MVAIEVVPAWMRDLEEEDVTFIKRFLLASGSLKEIARQYGVTYPTVRLRLDRLIQKIKLGEDRAADPYIALIKRLAVNERLDFDTAKLLIAADCTAYAYAAFHERFIRGHITLVGCPKLDSVDYSEKLTEIIRNNDIRSVTVVRMEVPCCGGLEMATKKALQQSGKFIPWQVVTVTVNGSLKEE